MSRTKHIPPTLVTIEPITVDRNNAALLLGIGLSTFEAHVTRGTLPAPRQLGGRALWLVAELRTAAVNLPISTLLPAPAAAAKPEQEPANA